MASAPAMNCCVWDQYKYALYTKFREPKLYRYAAKGDWDLIPDRCKVQPSEATFIHKYGTMDTPLHRILRTKNSFVVDELRVNIFEMKRNAVEALLEANPCGARMCDSVSRTPLHLACMDIAGNILLDKKGNDITVTTTTNSQTSIIELLLQVAPEAVSMKDIEQRTPLHYLLSRNDVIPTSILQKILEICPETVTMKDEVGESPLDTLKERSDEVQDVENLESMLLKYKSLRQ